MQPAAVASLAASRWRPLLSGLRSVIEKTSRKVLIASGETDLFSEDVITERSSLHDL